MSRVRRAYSRVKERGRSDSRAGFAARVGLVSAFGVLAVGVLMEEPTASDAIVMGASMTVAYYFFDPQDTG